MTQLVFRNGTIVTEDGLLEQDLVVQAGLIKGLVPRGEFVDGRQVDISGKLVLPGGVDVHTHLDSPSGIGHTTDTHLSGTRAAAVGGTTTLIDFAPQSRGETLLELMERWRAKMKNNCAIDYSFHATVSSWYDHITDDMNSLVQEGISSFKVYMAYKGAVMIDDGQLYEVLLASASQGSRICIHAENGDVIDAISRRLIEDGKRLPRYHSLARPAATESEAVNRAIMIAGLTGAAPYFVHLSAKESVDHVAKARQSGLDVAAETCTHYLTLDDSVYDSDDFSVAKYVLTPPLKTVEDQESLWNALKTGDLSVVSSDHCPLCLNGQKDLGRDDFRQIPNGGPGVEDRYIVTYSEGVAKGRLDITDFAKVIATEPAKLFGLYPQKGAIKIGSDADVVILDPNGSSIRSAAQQSQNVDYNLWEGWVLQGYIEQVYSRGLVVSEHGAFVGDDTHGQFIRRSRRS